MSFSISARGTRDEVLAQLGSMPVYGQLGADILSLITTTVRNGTDQLGADALEYEVYAAGHEDMVLGEHSVPSLSVRITAVRQHADEEPASSSPRTAQAPAST